jgi:hypothetical protein
MLNLKKTALAVIALGSTAAFAGTMGPVCSAVNVTVPCETCAWDVGGRALYLQPATVVGNTNFTLTQGTNSYSGGVSPQWGWGFQLEASYHYSTGNDMNLNWYHYRHGSESSLATPVTNLQGLGATGITAASASTNPAWDQVNIEFGQHVDFGENKFARLHGGFNFSRVGNNGYSSVVTTPVGIDSDLTQNYTAVYNGFGPRVGMDLNYEWGNGVGVYADGALSVLAGSSKGSLNLVNNRTAANSFTLSYSHSQVVGELDAKVGAMYTYAMAQGDLSLDVGWVWAQYMNPMTAPRSFDSANNDENTSSWGIQGLYFGAKWVGNVA